MRYRVHNSWQQAAKGTSAGSAPEPQETRMSLVDIAILILKLIVAALRVTRCCLKTP
ncbi:hypothetical protein ACLB1Q_22060 [Escherichia coli]